MPELPIDLGVMWTIPQLNDLRFMRAHFLKHAFAPHAHEYYVIGIVEAGVQTFNYGRQQMTTTPGRVIIINPGEVHTGEAVSQDGFSYRALYPSVELIEEVVQESSNRLSTCPQITGGVVQDVSLFQQVQQIHRLSEHDDDAMRLEVTLIEFLLRLISRYGQPGQQVSTYLSAHTAVDLAKDYIEAHYDQPISLAELSRMVHISRFHLARLFKHHVGMPPHKYLENVRIRHAERLLLTEMSIVEVAFATGFSSQSHLTRTFKRFLGTTPGEFLKLSKII